MVACLLLLAGRVPADEVPLALECRDGRCAAVLPSLSSADQYCLIVASLARGAGPYRVRISTDASAGPAWVVRAATTPDARWQEATAALQQRLHRKRHEPDTFPAAAEPARQRSFYLFTGENDFHNAESYVSIAAQLVGLGQHCQVYVDEQFLATQPAADGQLAPALRALVDDAMRTFDEDVFPQAQRRLGKVLDVDRDGRFTILFTPRMSKLANGKVSLGGMVRGSDFYRDLAAPFGNRCDMMFLNTDLEAGPHLRTLLAHEYTHAVIFSEHVFGDYVAGLPAQDEESWLNEGLAHVNEVLHGHSWSNLDYRISAFLNAPERYGLVVPDYYRAGLFRSHGHRGSAYLFLQWCCAKYGEDLLGRLVRTNLTGTRNLEVATGRPFAELFREWTVDLARGKCQPEPGPGFTRLLCGPRWLDLPLFGGACDVDLAGTGAAYLRLHSPRSAGGRIAISADAGAAANLQVTLLRLPAGTARLNVKVERANHLARLAVTAHGGDVTLNAIAWERLTPLVRRDEDTSFRPHIDPRGGVRACFGPDVLKAGQTRLSAPITLPPDLGPAVFKITGTGSDGQPVHGWATELNDQRP